MTKQVHIVIVNAVFPPEPVVSAKMGYDFALHLSEQGHKVDVICPIPTRPQSFDYSTYKTKQVEIVNNNLKIHRLNSYANPKSKIIGRFLESMSFGKQSSDYIKQRFSDADVVYANTWPLMAQYLLSKACKSLNIPLAFHVKDVYPESLLKKINPVLRWIVSKPLFLIEKSSMKTADIVILLSDRTASHYHITRDLEKNKIKTVFDWQNPKPFTSYIVTKSDVKLFSAIKQNKFTFMYMGNIGPVAGVDFLIDSFIEANLTDCQLVIAGDGSKKDDCINKVKKANVENIIFVSVPDGKVPAVQYFANVLILPVNKGEAYNSVPSKLISYLFSAKPVLASLDLDSDTSKFIQTANAGWVVEPENINALSLKMIEISKNTTSNLQEIGKKGFEYGIKQFSMDEGVKKLTELVICISKNNNGRYSNKEAIIY